MIALRLNKRRDGSICVTDANGSASSPDRAFPPVHWFGYDKLVELGVARDGDRLTLDLANGRAVYRIVDDMAEALALLELPDDAVLPPTGVVVELVSADLFDPPPIDEKAARKIAKARADAGDLVETSVANAGAALVDEGKS